MPDARPVTLFYSYSRRDERLRAELERHLQTLQRERLVSSWHFRKIEAGEEWRRRISDELNAADVIVLLVSSDFVASDYCWNIEMKRALERHEQGTAVVVPVLLRPCDWATAPFAKLQTLPADAKPVIDWRPRDRAWADVTAGLRRRVEVLRTRPDGLMPSSVLLAKAVSDRHERIQEVLSRGTKVVRHEVTRMLGEIDRIVQVMKSEAPHVPIKYSPNHFSCRVRVGYHVFDVSAQIKKRLTSSVLHVAEAFHGDDDVPIGGTRHREYYFRIADDGSIGWDVRGKLMAATEMADHLVRSLIADYASLEGRI